jgi:hypothetical protein
MSLYNKNLQYYWEYVLSLGLEQEVTAILKIDDLDQRYTQLKKLFNSIDPKLVDDKIVWNLYKETL